MPALLKTRSTLVTGDHFLMQKLYLRWISNVNKVHRGSYVVVRKHERVYCQLFLR